MPLFWFPTKELTVVCSLWLLYPLPPTIIDSLGSASFPPPVLEFLTASMDSTENTLLEQVDGSCDLWIHASKDLKHSKDGYRTNALTGGHAEFPVVCHNSQCG